MVQVRTGDLFQSSAQTLVNTVNCVGVMGKGIALGFKQRFPEMFADYARRCERHEVRLGQPYLFKTLVPPWVLNFPTKDHWRGVSHLKDIVAGLEYLVAHYEAWGIESLAVPPLGCGNGGLDWQVVGPTLYKQLSRLAIPVDLYAPAGTPADQLTPTFLGGAGVWPRANGSAGPGPIPPAWVALVAIVARVQSDRYHWPVGRTSFQKMAYFATALGLPTGLRHERGSYGMSAAATARLHPT
jgi:O-acetyl-ADP-ribose deacetylase (regulator of RNase III)